MKENIFLVFSTCADEAAAGRIARALVEERLAACVNLQPGVRSVYRWEGEIREEPECLLIAKTPAARLGALTDRLAALHDYELPEIVAVPVRGGSQGYLDWVARECGVPAAG